MSIREALGSNQKDQEEINRIRRNYHENPPAIDVREFIKVIESRRSIRRFQPVSIPEEIVRDCLRLAHLAPNSSSLMPWEFYWIRNPELKSRVAEICMAQPAARTAAELVVCVARTETWQRNSRMVLEEMTKIADPSPSTREYYRRLLPLQFATGFLSWWVPFKWMIFTFGGLFQPMMRFPLGKSDMRVWAVKSASLACENLMLSFRAYGYDSCAMEGFDEVRLRRLLKLPRKAEIVMVVGAGKREKGGVYGPQIRLPIEHFVFEV